MARVVLQPAFVLHTRAFRDTSLIVDFFTLKYGRISCLARGAKSSKSKLRGLLLPFVPLLVSWSGKSDLVTLSKIETNNKPYNITGSNLLSGLYLNELLVKLLAQHDPHPNIFRIYQNTLNNLQNNNNIQITLRLFEKQLLAEIGYGLQLTKDASGQAILSNNYYQYKYEHGFINCFEHEPNAFSGKSLLALHHNKLTDMNTLTEIKHLMRLIYNHLLGDKPLKSRELLYYNRYYEYMDSSS
jgi:DNA repair protein RecO (recombination protein O)